MANTLLSPTIVTREALDILHQKLNFVGSINRQYDDQFANSGASPSGKIGPNLTIRMPNKYTVRTGNVMVVQDTAETSQTLTVSTVKGVDMQFPQNDLTLTIDKFSERYIEPAMSVLASAIEADALSMLLDIYQLAPQGTITAGLSTTTILNGGKILNDALAPQDGRNGLLTTQNYVDLVDSGKAVFNPQSTIGKQWTTGQLGDFDGFSFKQNTLLTKFTSGTETAGTMQVNGATQTGASVTVTNGSSKTLKKGDVITFVGCNRVHPETKADTGIKQQFVVTADVATSGTSIGISPAIVTTGATQNVTASPTTAQTIAKVTGGASGVMDTGVLFHKNAFTFVTADLYLPKNQHFVGRQVMDGISMRIWTGADIINGLFPTRIDVLYGYKTIRPELACRTASNSTA